MSKNKTNVELGLQVRGHLEELKLEDNQGIRLDMARVAMQNGTHHFLHYMGLLPDPSRDDTPKRVADMFVDDLCWGLDYNNFPKCTTTPNDMGYDQMVRVKNIQTTSLCEHHFQTIYGHTHVAYIPGERVLGLSKFARVTEFFARRPQIQERMTEQLHAALCFILATEDVAVVQDCQHFCMIARGCQQHGVTTQTDKLSGRFMTNPSLRQEFFHGIR